MATIGEVSEIPFVIEWKIQDFLSLPSKEDVFFVSRSFSFANESWYLKIYPNGETKVYSAEGRVENSIGYIDILLCRKSSGFPISLEYSLGFETLDRKVVPERHYAHVFENMEGYGSYRFLNRDVLLRRKIELVPSGVLTVICKMKDPKSAKIANEESLCQDFKKVLLDGRNHDLILRVGDKEFRAHQDILKSRSQVFDSMLNHDMREKNSGVVDIPDCDPKAMEQFLLYVYSGKVEMLDQSNMLGLYYIADKYDMKGLKAECSAFIKKSLSVTNIYEIIQLAMNHGDSSLLDNATEYFRDNMLDIMGTVEWESFVKDNFTVANDLLMKSIKTLKDVKT